MKVKDCMCNDVCCVKPETKINEVAKIMSQNHIGCVPVCDQNNCICGIITDRDILLRSVACDKDTCQTTASEIMSKDVCTCNESDDMINAESKMANYQVRRLPVCDQDNHVIGILTLGDLAANEQINDRGVTDTLNNICGCNDKNAE